MKKSSKKVTVKELRAALDLAQNLIKAVHAAVDQMPDAEIRVPGWVWRDVARGGEEYPPFSVDSGCRCIVRRTRKRT